MNSCYNKAYKKSYLAVHTYNNNKKNLVLMYLSKIPEVSYDISICLNVII